MSRRLDGRVILPGAARGRVLRLQRPISFWGGVDPDSGRITDPRHPDHGQVVAGRILAIPATIGSSSSSAVLLELLRNGRAPAALLLGAMDAILVLGVVVGRELGYPVIPVLTLTPEQLAALPAEGEVTVTESGRIAT